MTVVSDSQGWWVEHGGAYVVGPFLLNAEAWKWIDKNAETDFDKKFDQRQRRIATAFYDY